MLLMSLQNLENQQGQNANKKTMATTKMLETKVRAVLDSNTNASIKLDVSRVCF